jgi:ATP-binding cassette subfamily F protein 3
MTVLTIRDLSLRIAGRLLLDQASLVVDPGRKVGLVGRNGAGKSTMLKAITGDLAPDGGEIRLAQRARMGHVAQEAPGGPETLLETVLAADTERAALLAEAEGHPDGHRMGEIHERLIAIGADSAPARAAVLAQAESLVLDAAPIIPIYFNTHVYLLHPAVKGWQPTPADYSDFRYVYLQP